MKVLFFEINKKKDHVFLPVSRMITVVLVIFVFSSLQAQEEYAEQIDVSRHAVVKRNGKSRVTIDVVLDRLNIRKNHLVVLTPIISSFKNNETVELPVMVIKGKLRDRKLSRPYVWKGKQEFMTKETYQVVRKNDTRQTIIYCEDIPYEEWQQYAGLRIKAEVMGCAGCDLRSSMISLKDSIFTD